MSESSYIALTGRGRALLAAVKAGLLPEQNGEYDTAAFDRFFDICQAEELSDIEKCLAESQEHVDHLLKMLDQECQQRAEDRNYYLTAQRRTLLASVSLPVMASS